MYGGGGEIHASQFGGGGFVPAEGEVGEWRTTDGAQPGKRKKGASRYLLVLLSLRGPREVFGLTRGVAIARNRYFAASLDAQVPETAEGAERRLARRFRRCVL